LYAKVIYKTEVDKKEGLLMTGKTISSPVRMDKETKTLLQERAKAHGLSESGYIRMLIRREAGIGAGDKPHRAPIDLFREIFNSHAGYEDNNKIKQMREAPGNEHVKRLSRAVDMLDERESQFIRDRFFEGMTYAEIGERYEGLSSTRVSQIIHRALTRLRHPLRTKVILGS
jgi:RNA polymerase sigma factor (sigma-70 family)